MIFRLIVCFLQVGTIIRQGALLLVLRMAAGGHYYFARHYYRFCENLQGGTIIQQALLFGKLEYVVYHFKYLECYLIFSFKNTFF